MKIGKVTKMWLFCACLIWSKKRWWIFHEVFIFVCVLTLTFKFSYLHKSYTSKYLKKFYQAMLKWLKKKCYWMSNVIQFSSLPTLRLAKIDIRYDWIAHNCYSAIQTNLFLFLLPFSPSHLLFPSGRLADGALASPGTILWNDYCVTDVMCLESVYVTRREKGRWSTLHLIGTECRGC